MAPTGKFYLWPGCPAWIKGHFVLLWLKKFNPSTAFNEFHRLVAEELAKFHEAARGSDLYVDKSCRPGDMGWMDPINRSTMSNLKELEAKGEHSDV